MRRCGRLSRTSQAQHPGGSRQYRAEPGDPQKQQVATRLNGVTSDRDGAS